LKLIFSSISELTKQFFFNLNYCDKILKNYELGNLRISDDLWKNCVRYQPIFAIDVVIYCKNLGILTGKRKNQPAKNKFFVPGGRVFKNESRDSAFERITKNEIGLILKLKNTSFIGIYEHFYENSKWENEGFGTHYIVEARFIEVDSEFEKSVNMDDQHSHFKWIDSNSKNELEIHKYCNPYFRHVYK